MTASRNSPLDEYHVTISLTGQIADGPGAIPGPWLYRRATHNFGPGRGTVDHDEHEQ